MKRNDLYINVLFVYLLCIYLPVKSQSIIGDTIYVNSKVEVAVQFPSMPNSFFTNPVDAPYDIKTLGTGFTIIAKTKNTPPASLSVMEGKRSHLFLIRYKKNIDIYKKEETYLDYSSVKYLEDHIKKKEAERDVEGKYTTLRVSAENNVKQKKFNEAKDDYEHALQLKPNDKKAKRELAKVNKLLNAKTKRKTERTSLDGNNNQPYYTRQELDSKYPGIDFTKPVPDQKFDEKDFDAKKNARSINEVLAEKARLTINDADHKVKLICQGLSFKNKAVYIRLLVQNGSKEDFLTGSMSLTWKKKKSKPEDLNPVYLFPDPLPVIKAGNEAIIMYIFMPVNIADNDVLNFRLIDRSTKTKLEIKIKGSLYNEESIRLL